MELLSLRCELPLVLFFKKMIPLLTVWPCAVASFHSVAEAATEPEKRDLVSALIRDLHPDDMRHATALFAFLGSFKRKYRLASLWADALICKPAVRWLPIVCVDAPVGKEACDAPPVCHPLIDP